MVSGVVGELHVKLKFTLSNGTQFTLNDSSSLNQTNYLSSIKLSESFSADQNIPVGVNTSNVLDLVIVSTNHALIPENENSTYYGYMNNSAIIEIYVTEGEDEIYFGKYYVDKWKSNITSDTPNNVVISATNLMGIIAKQDVPDVEINTGMMIKDYLEELVYELNQVLPNNKQISSDSDSFNFDAFPVMQFSNINTDSVGDCLNGISQCTLTNIYIDRNGKIGTDYNCDDQYDETEYYFDVMTSAQTGTGSLVDYDGVKVNYSAGNILDVEQLASLYDQDALEGETEFDNINLGDAVYKINSIDVTTDDNSNFIELVDAKYNKDKMRVTVNSQYPTKVNIVVKGQRLDNTTLVFETTGDNKLEITNRIIPALYIPKWAGNLQQLMQFKANSMSVQGYFNPRIKLGDVVYINCDNAMSISGYYKINRLDWDFGQYGKCTMYLIKTFEVAYNVNSVMDNLNNKLELTMNAMFPKTSEFVSLNQSENTYMNEELDDELSVLRQLQYGG